MILAAVPRPVVEGESANTSFVVHPAVFQGSGKGRKIWNSLNEAKANTLHFLKLMWAYLWTHKPQEVLGINSENPFAMSAAMFCSFLIDTLAQVALMRGQNMGPDAGELLYLEDDHLQQIVKKCLGILTVICK
jgi:hypothetical protein